MGKRAHTLQFRHELKQYLLPTLTYYLRLLELPSLELESIIRQTLEENQLLEEIPQELEGVSEAKDNKKAKESSNDADEFGILELFAEGSNITYENSDEEFDPTDNMPAYEDKLYDHLMRQSVRKFKDKDLEIAELVIVNVEEDGYLAASAEELSRDGYDINDIIRVIKEIQHFDPIGCAWRDVKESLLVQLDILGYKSDSLEYVLVRDYLNDLKNNNIGNLINKLNIDEERFKKAKKVIMKLNPCPGLQYAGEPSRYVMPDFIIRWQDNRLIAQLNESEVCRIRIKNQYLEMLKHSSNIPAEELNFVKQKARSAQNLIIAIEQRRKTLNRIINSLLEYQRNFFEKGPGYLRPITMTDFAKQLNVNPSTISRALANKYVESPWGIHKMKFFFSAAVGKTDKRLIFERIKDIITNEDNAAPLSDAQIAKKLSREGIIISRRTVSKYREHLNIVAHQFRKKF